MQFVNKHTQIYFSNLSGKFGKNNGWIQILRPEKDMEKVRVLPSLTNIKINNMNAIVAAIHLSISLMATMMARFAAMKPSLKQQDMSTI